MLRYPRYLLFVLVLGAALLIAGCGSGGGDATRVEVRAAEFSFAPATLTLSAGTPYRLLFRNSGSVLHDWTVAGIPAEGMSASGSGGHDMAGMSVPAGQAALHVSAEGGKSAELTFTPTQPGEYEYECTVTGHREAGMRGRLVVQG